MVQTILNLTGRPITPEMGALGVVDLEGYDQNRLIDLLWFKGIPTKDHPYKRATKIVDIATDWWNHVDPHVGQSHLVLIDAEPCFIHFLCWAFECTDIIVLFAFRGKEAL